MGGSLDWVMCPVCGYEAACLDFELKDGTTTLLCSRCGYNSELNHAVFSFLYRKEFRIKVIANDIEEAYVKAQTGQWASVTLIPDALHYDMLEEEVDV